MKNIKILIVTHKDFSFPKDEIYLPIQAGKCIAKNKLEIIGDDTGENISEKNLFYGELTAQFWAWKNLNVDIIGLCHYRRYFDLKKYNLMGKSIKDLLNHSDLILPSPNNYPYSLYIDYKVNHVNEDILIIDDIIKKLYHYNKTSFIQFLKKTNKLSPYNMMICKKDLFDEYCNWLFPILFEAEKKINISPYLYQQRVFGFMAERLLNYFCYQKNLKVKYLPIKLITDKPIKAKSNILKHQVKGILTNLVFQINKHLF